MQVTPERQAEVIAALTENDVRAMNAQDVTDFILDALDRQQLCLLLHYISGYSPKAFARAARRIAAREAAARAESPMAVAA